METNFVLLSDLHIGYEKSILKNETNDAHLSELIASLSDGKTDRLILNGDVFEACVPDDAGEEKLFGLSPYTVNRAKSFFDALFKKMKIGKIVILWGNHDYATWEKLATNIGMETFTNNKKENVVLKNGSIFNGAQEFLQGIFGENLSGVDEVKSAYPIYCLGKSWPYLVFHHGHFLDDLILGQKSDAEYLGLEVMTEAERPKINIHEEQTLFSIHHKTSDFISKMWTSSSHIREIEWAILRRLGDHPRCSFYPGDSSAPAFSRVLESEPHADKLASRLTWFTNLLMADPVTPAPIGDPLHPSYLFIGHDHRGGFARVEGMDGMNWKVVNSGGWTDDTDRGRNVHSHIVTWRKGENSPMVHCAKI